MDELTARSQIEAMTAWDSAPALSIVEVEELVGLAKRVDASGTPASIDAWQASTRYVAGQVVRPTAANGHRYIADQDGTSGATEPAWPTGEGSSLSDGTIVWVEAGTDTWVPTWDLNAAAAEGWRRKAAKVAGAYSFSDAGASFDRSDMVNACMAMVRVYERGAHTVRPS